MPSNDTENIYATQYGGEGEPIPATKISYDNTTSGLTADDIQEAVDEVALEAKGASQAISDVEDALENCWVISDFDFEVKVDADGIKTYDALLTELNTAFIAAISALEDNERFIIERLQVSNVATLVPIGKPSGYTNADTEPSPFCFRTEITAAPSCSTIVVRFGGASNIFKISASTGTPTVTFTDKLSDVPSNGNSITISLWKVKKL